MPLNEGREEIARAPEEVTGQPRRLVLGELMLRQTFSALRHRNFRLFFSGQLVSLIGTWMQNTAQGLLVYQLTKSEWLLGVVTSLTKQMWGDIPVIPTMSTGATDGKYMRAVGIPTFGVSGLFSEPGESNAHGRDEKMRVKSFYDGLAFLDQLVRRLSGVPAA